MTVNLVVLFVATCTLLSSCFMSTVFSSTPTGVMAERAALAKEAQGDTFFVYRDHKDQLLKALALWQESVDLRAEGRVFAKLARGHYLLADSFYAVSGDVALRDKHFALGLGFAEKSLHFFAPSVIDDAKNGAAFAQAVKNAPVESLPGLYWYAANLGKWAAHQSFVTRLRYRNDLKAAMNRIKELDANYFYAGSWRLLAAYEALTAGMAGGDLKQAEHYFAEAAKRAPHFLGTKVLWAEYLCVQQKDQNNYKKLLEQVLAADANADPLIVAENRLEQHKARQLLEKFAQVF